MRIPKYLYGLFLSLCFVVSCSEAEGIQEANYIESGQTITIEAAQEGYASETRTIRQEDGSVFWNPGDEISLFFMRGENGGNKFTSQNTEVAEIAEFAGTINGITGGGEGLSGDAYFWAIYPFSKENSCENNSVITVLPNTQQGIEESFADDLFITIARSTGVKMGFKNLCGGLKFCVSQSGIRAVSFRGNKEEVLAGKVRAGFNASNVPVVTEVLDGKTEVTLVAPNGGEFEVGKFYYAVLLPATLSEGFTMTFHKSDDTYGVYTHSKSVTFKRSIFGTVRNLDNGLTFDKNQEGGNDVVAGNNESGFYLGVIGFNNELFSYPIKKLTEESVEEISAFIDGLTMNKFTLLFHAVDNSINVLQNTTLPNNLYNSSIITFTDGLDRGSLGKSNYSTDEEYLAALQTRITEEKVSGKDIAAYTIGLLGREEQPIELFHETLENLASSSNNAYTAASMDDVNDRFNKLAEELSDIKNIQDIQVQWATMSDQTRCRVTFDNTKINQASESQRYLEGVFHKADGSLNEVIYVGMTSQSGSTIIPIPDPDGISLHYSIKGIQTDDGELITKDDVALWRMTKYGWASDWLEIGAENEDGITKRKQTAAIVLNLDCTNSLQEDFARMQSIAKSFVSKLYTNSIDPNEVASISLDKSSANMLTGETITLKATVLPTTALDPRVEWSSTNTSVATVSQTGVVTAVGPGSATIIAKTLDGGLTATCKVSVIMLAKEIQFASSNLVIYNGYLYTLEATVFPENTSNKTLKWSSSNTAVATVDPTGTITPIKAGTTTITATAQDGSGVKATCNITIRQRVESITLDSESISIYINETNKLTATVLPTNATNKKVVWSSSDTSVATVNQEGLVSAIAVGKVQITASTQEGGVKAVCEVEVVQPITKITLNSSETSNATESSLYINETLQLSASVQPSNASYKSVLWTSSNPTVATVDQNGLVTTLSAGSTTITASAQDGTGIESSCLITVWLHAESVTLNQTSVRLYEGNQKKLIATVLPNEANKGVTWQSSDESVASVSQSGLVTAHTAGTSQITATTKDGGFIATCDVSVIAWSQNPVDMSLAVQKNGVRYFIPLADYSIVDLTGCSKEGVAVLSDSESFILALNPPSFKFANSDIYYNEMTLKEAGEVATLPTKEQASIIVNKWTMIDSAMDTYGGMPMGNNTYWTSSSYYVKNSSGGNNPTSVTQSSVVGGITFFYYCYNATKVSSTASSSTLYYVRGIVDAL